MEHDQGVGREVKRLREARGWSQTRLAGEAGMSASGVSMIENGHRNLSTETLAKLAKALEVEVRDLFPLEQPPLLDFEAERRAGGPKVVRGAMHAKVDARTFAVLEWALAGVIDELADGKISREEAKAKLRQLRRELVAA